MRSILFQAEHSWEGLLQRIENREVIPVIGPDLSLTTIGGKHASFYQHLADALLQARGTVLSKFKRGRNLGGARTLDAIFRAVPARDRADLYEQVIYLVNQLAAHLPPPTPLRQLAEILHFDLFVTTTFDPLLERAINDVRFGGQSLTDRGCFTIGSSDDAAETISVGGTVVFHLLGRTSAWDTFAVTEEDTLEFVSSIQAAARPRWLFDRLKTSDLLLLGNSYPDWLGRFFLRLTKNQRLTDQRKRLEIVADDTARAGDSFSQFVSCFSEETRIYPQGAVEFVQQLHTRWRTRFGRAGGSVAFVAEPKEVGIPATAPNDPGSMPRGFIFLSYAREDQSAVKKMHQALAAARLNVWFDEKSVKAGDLWNNVIRANIWRCSLFVPVLSRNTMARREGVFWRECNWARERLKDMDIGTVFIVPVVIDDSGENAVPLDFRVHHYSDLLGGRTSHEFVQRLIRLVRGWERSQKGRALADVSSPAK